MKSLWLVALLLDTSGRRNSVDPYRCQLTQSYAVAEEYVFAAAVAPGGQIAAAGRRDGAVAVFDPQSGRRIRSFEGHEGYVYATAFSPDGTGIVTGGADGTVRLWSMEEGAVAVLKGHQDAVWCVAFARKGKALVSGGADGIILWDLDRRRRERSFSRNVITVAAHGDRVVSGHGDGTVVLWDWEGREQGRFSESNGAILSLVFHPNGRWLAAAGQGGEIRVWDLDTRKLLRTLQGHVGSVQALAFSSDGRLLASAGSDIRLWDARSGRPLRRLEPPAPAYGIAFARYGTSLLATCGDNRLRLWGTSPTARGLVEPPAERQKGFLGVSYSDAGGALISSVVAGSQAEKCGFQANDVIVGCDDRSFPHSDDFLNFMKESHEGQEVWVRFKREGADKTTKVKLGRWP